jgi:hypothetical protein
MRKQQVTWQIDPELLKVLRIKAKKENVSVQGTAQELIKLGLTIKKQSK